MQVICIRLTNGRSSHNSSLIIVLRTMAWTYELVLSLIPCNNTYKLAEDAHSRTNIDLVDQSTKETYLEMVEVRKIDMKHSELLVGLLLMGEVGCTSDFRGKVVMQIEQFNRVHAISEVHLKHLSNVLHYDLFLVWERYRGPFKVLKRISQGLQTRVSDNTQGEPDVQCGYAKAYL
ncbi:hypothetical protein J1N35_041929 [Gossypium stocksii]|uniref:Uncharacterized protein n=1 Tax=Gossypium stocksii TaxID=47602 RepID=A0A9D3UGN1_9ROSI|nr:hypothetical protein J1N35_041929 [Gossypium stocksii]